MRISSRYLITAVLLIVIGLQPAYAAQKLSPVLGDDNRFRIVSVVDGLQNPWGMAFLPDGRILVTERPGRLRVIDNGVLVPKPVKGLPGIAATGQGGLLDVALHPDYEKNGWIYLSYVAAGDGGIGTELARARLDNMELRDLKVLFRLSPKSRGGRHFGSRIVFDKAGFLFLTIGDRGDRDRAQMLNDHAGSVIRLHDDGSVPTDNPFLTRSEARREIYSFGHRNPQGFALHPENGDLWLHEHGPQGGDELNKVKPGVNYGWPVITYGVNYGFGTRIGEGTHKTGMQQPDYYWVPSIAPSGMSFYSGDKFPEWQGDLLVGSLKFQLLVHLKMDGDQVVKETRYLKGDLGRIRDVRVGPEGYIYLLTDAYNGRLVRIGPR